MKTLTERLNETLETIECPNGCGCKEFRVDCKSVEIQHAVLDRDGDLVDDWKDSGDGEVICYRVFCENCEDDPYIVEIK